MADGVCMSDVLGQVKRHLTSLTVGLPWADRDITIYPLLADDPQPSELLLLDEALGLGSAKVEEVGEGGTVPVLRLLNYADRDVLVTEGDILIGGKQNRVVNESFVVLAGKGADVPVSCVEQGRWHRSSAKFSSDLTATPGMRSHKTRSYLQNQERGVGKVADQGEVWASVTTVLHQSSAHSSTSSVHEAYAVQRQSISDTLRRIPMPKTAVGVAVVIDGTTSVIELFDSPETFKSRWEKLGTSYILEARMRRGARSASGTRGVERVQEVLATMADTLAPAPTASAEGTSIRFSDARLSGSGLWFKGRVRHLVAFPV